MYRPLLLNVLLPPGILLLGCHDPTTGGDPDSLPMHTVSYRARHTYPIVARAVLPKVMAEFPPDSAMVHTFEFNETDASLANIVASEFEGEPINFVRRSQVSEENGRFIDAESGNTALIWSIMGTGSKRDWLRFRVECRRGKGTSDYYEVILRGSEHTFGWTVSPDSPRKL
jgi:hypothetical protein